MSRHESEAMRDTPLTIVRWLGGYPLCKIRRRKGLDRPPVFV
jgi:hypothetical protein